MSFLNNVLALGHSNSPAGVTYASSRDVSAVGSMNCLLMKPLASRRNSTWALGITKIISRMCTRDVQWLVCRAILTHSLGNRRLRRLLRYLPWLRKQRKLIPSVRVSQ